MSKARDQQKAMEGKTTSLVDVVKICYPKNVQYAQSKRNNSKNLHLLSVPLLSTGQLSLKPLLMESKGGKKCFSSAFATIKMPK